MLARPCRSDGPARSVQVGVEIKLEFPFNALWACLCRQTGLPQVYCFLKMKKLKIAAHSGIYISWSVCNDEICLFPWYTCTCIFSGVQIILMDNRRGQAR
jgi:hypothetical protein